MLNRSWLWLIARLGMVLVLGAIVAIFRFSGGGGEKEFQKSLDALKQVHSVRASYSGTPTGYAHNNLSWEIDCDRGIVHQQQHITPLGDANADGSPTSQYDRDELYVAGHEYQRLSDGAWMPVKYGFRGGSPSWYCTNLAAGTDTNVLPPIATMLKRGILQKGDKKTVNGVRCREWLVTMKNGMANLEHDTVCLGLNDHLPYEMTIDWQGSHSTFSDYNTTIQFDLPETAVQPASAANRSN